MLVAFFSESHISFHSVYLQHDLLFQKRLHFPKVVLPFDGRLRFADVPGAFPNDRAGGAKFIAWNLCQFQPVLFAGGALLDRIRVVSRISGPLFAGVKPEHLGIFALGRLVPGFHGLVAVSDQIFGSTYLLDGTTAVKTVRRIILVPKRIGRRQSYTVQFLVRRANLLVPGGTVLE